MASINQLREVAGRYAQSQPRGDTGLMQHASARQSHEVEISERTGSNIYTGRSNRPVGTRSNAARRERVEQTQQVVTERQPDEQSEAMGKQTQVLKSQSGTLTRQTGILDQQTSLMGDQIRATQNVADIVKRLAEYMEKQANKPVPKIQDTRKGNTYEGEFSRVPNAGELRRKSIMDDLREARSRRAREQPRDERGRFKRKIAERVKPKIQQLGGSRVAGLGGRLGGLAMRAGGPLAMLAAMFYGSKALDAVRDNYEYDKNSAGTIAHGWQTAKDKVGDWAGNGTQVNLVGNKMTDQQTDRITNRASNGPLGSVAEAFESGGRGVGTVSTGKGDKGGVSYGAHQLSSSSGTMSAFLRSEEGSKFYGDFRGLAPGSKEFNDKYAEVSKTKGAEFGAAQSNFIKKTHYDPVAKWFGKQFGIDPEKRSKALREMLYSIGVQYGFTGARQLISEALGNRDPSKMTDKDLINYIQNFRYGSAPDKFRSSSAATIQSVQDRAINERDVLLKMVDRESSGANNTNMGGTGQSVLREQGGNAGSKTIMQSAAESFKPAAGAGGGGSDEAGGGTFASPTGGSGPQANGNFYNLGIKHTIPKDNSVNMAGLNDKFKQAFYTMVGDWVTNAKGTRVTVASAFRTRAEQEELWVKYGRNTKRVARPGTSRHESGFAIDIDRVSAQSLESSGMFKKYGFHRPLANEPWHVEMIGAGKAKGGGGGGDVATQPMTMQAAAVSEMNKAADETVKQAEENTKTDVQKQPAAAAGAMPSDTEAKPNATVEAGAKQADNAVKNDQQKAGEGTGAPASASDVTTTPVSNGITAVPTGGNGHGRTPEQQALYEQYLKAAGGDPRKVPDTVTNGYGKAATNIGGTPTYNMPANTPAPPVVTAGAPTVDKIGTLAPGQSPIPNGTGGAGTGTGVTYGPSGQQPGVMDSLSKVFDVRRPTGGTNPYSGMLYGSGNDDVAKGIRMARSVDPTGTNAVTGGIGSVLSTVGAGMAIGKADNKVDAVLQSGALPGVSREMGTFNSAVRQWDYNPVAAIQTMQQSNVVKAAQSGLSSLFGLGGPKSPEAPNNAPTMTRGAPVMSTADIGKPVVQPNSAASKTYYNSDTPVITKPASGPTATMAPVTSSIAAAPVERNTFDAVQTVRVADAAPPSTPAAPAGSGGGGGQSAAAGNGSKSDAVQLDEVPAIIDDFGLLFINAGFS